MKKEIIIAGLIGLAAGVAIFKGYYMWKKPATGTTGGAPATEPGGVKKPGLTEPAGVKSNAAGDHEFKAGNYEKAWSN